MRFIGGQQRAWLARHQPDVLLLAFTLVEIGLITVTRLFMAGPDGGDLCRDYLDARRLLAGQDVYAPFASCGVLHHSPHPPLALLLLTPLALFPVNVAAFIWNLLMLAALVAALALIWRELAAQLDPRWLAALLLGLAIWPPLLDTWLESQISPLILLLLALAWRARRRDEPWLAGAWLALATLLRLYPVLLFVYPLLRKEWRLIGSGALTGVGVMALTLPFIGLGDDIAYVTREAPGASAEWVNDAHNVAWRGWLGQLFTGSNTIHPVISAPEIVGPLFVVGIIALLGLLLWRSWQARTTTLGSLTDDLAWLLGIPVMLLISPLAWPHYFIILLLPLLVAGDALWRAGRWSPNAILLAASMGLLYLNAIGLRLLFPLPRLLPWPAAVFVFALPFYALVCHLAAIARLERPHP